MNIIEQIKAEIERLRKVAHLNRSEYSKIGNFVLANSYSGGEAMASEILSFLSTLESEKPIPSALNGGPSLIRQIRAKESLSNDLEEAARRYAHCPFTDDDGNFHEDAIDGTVYHDFIAGAKWQKEQYHFFNEAWADDMQAELDRNYENGKLAMKEQIMNEAVEGCVNYYEDSGGILMAEAQVGCPYHSGDKVRMIILPKED